MNPLIQEFQQEKNRLWAEVLEKNKLLQRVRSGNFNKEIYGRYLVETYHYTKHNSINQAHVALRPEAPTVYAKFCLHHAEEEHGHELMALHDIESMGLLPNFESELREPLNSTQTLIGYLYWISKSGNVFQRLGYSFWAEDSYSYIREVLAHLQKDLSLSNSQMTFFRAHALIDKGHAEEVESIITRFVHTPEDIRAFKNVMKTSLHLTAAMMDEVAEVCL